MAGKPVAASCCAGGPGCSMRPWAAPDYCCLVRRSVISHVIPLRLVQILNWHRWNCNVCGLSRKMTELNYVRNLSGGGVSAAGPSARRACSNRWARANRWARTNRWVLPFEIPEWFPNNVACNSPEIISKVEFTTLELQRFQTLLKLHPIELHATFLGALGGACRRRSLVLRTGSQALQTGSQALRTDGRCVCLVVAR